MIIYSADFLMSNTDVAKCPPANKPEYAFIGRSNVGKSSLINLLVNQNQLAKVSASPGKTQTINHFLVNKEWYLVDLPGYGYAKTSKHNRDAFSGFTKEYIQKRPNLIALFVLIDARHAPLKIDMEFMEQLALNEVPFVMVFTKIDKLSKLKIELRLQEYTQKMLETWEELPHNMSSSAVTKHGRDEILNYIESLNKQVKPNFT
jgi:GTP-binding protein